MVEKDDLLLEYNLSPKVTAFTTKRSLGRDRVGMCRILGIADSHLIIPHQTHGVTIRQITADLVEKSDAEKKEILEAVDSVITNLRGVCIGVSTADCIPVLLYDEPHAAVAAVHAGWRGTVEKIVEKTIGAMHEAYGTEPSDLKAVIGPGITQKNFEVGDEVYEKFHEAGFDMNSISERYVKYHLDLHQCNKMQLLAHGVKEDNIQMHDICTYDNTHMFFSARVEQKGNVKCGRNFNAIMIDD